MVTIVTGEPRSGTSLMMQTLAKLGMPMTGEMQPRSNREKQLENRQDLSEQEKKDMQKRVEHAEKMNPLGFYEISGVVASGISTDAWAEKCDGKVVKIVTSGIPYSPDPRPHGTPKEIIGKMILCLRDPKHIAISQQDLMSEIQIASDDEWTYSGAFKPSPMRYIGITGSFAIWLDENPDIKEKILTVEYEDMLTDPKGTIEKVAEFLELDVDITEAVENVKPKLRRSAVELEWDSDLKREGMIADSLYKSLQQLETGVVSVELKEYFDSRRNEGIMWVDDTEYSTWANISPDAFRRFKTDESFLDHFKKQYQRNFKAGLVPTICKYFSVNGQTYTINRPKDIGDLTRKKVACARDKDSKTAEDCKHCWQYGWNRGDAHEPEMKLQTKNYDKIFTTVEKKE